MMKRLMTATALTALLATGASAQSEAEMTQINRYLPDTDVSVLSETEITTLLAIANGGESETEKRTQMQAVVADSNRIETEVTEADLARLQRYAPDIDFSSFTQADLVEAQAIANSGLSDTEVAQRLQAFDSGRNMVMSDRLTWNEYILLNNYLPTVDLSALSDEKLQRMVGIVNGNEDMKRRRLLDIVNG